MRTKCAHFFAYAVLLMLLLGGVSTRAQEVEISKPEKNFEAFWLFFSDNYAFFKEKNICWDATYNYYRPRVNAKTSNDSLYAIFCAMVKPLNDGHVGIYRRDGQHFSAKRPSRMVKEFCTDSLRKQFWPMVDSSLTKNGFAPMKYLGREFKGKPLFAYTSNGKVGYIRFTRCFSSWANMRGFRTEHYLKKIMKEFESLEGVVVDVRFNIGGDDKFALNVAGHFTKSRILVHYKQTRIEATPVFTMLQPIYLKPRGSKPFEGKVVVLTNDRTASAADVFALDMAQLPNVVLVGENSEGVFSDIFSRRLPNGWKVTLSNQRYFSPQMQCYEGEGVPVSVEALNSLSDLGTMDDAVMKKALNVLNENASGN